MVPVSQYKEGRYLGKPGQGGGALLEHGEPSEHVERRLELDAVGELSAADVGVPQDPQGGLTTTLTSTSQPLVAEIRVVTRPRKVEHHPMLRVRIGRMSEAHE